MTLFGILNIFASLLSFATPIVVALALLYFFWGLATFILNSGNEEERKKGRNIMIYGLLALFVMVSVWGIINVVRDTFQLDDTFITIPGVNTGGAGGTR